MSTLEEQLGQEAGREVREETARILREKGPNLEKVLLRLRQALNAKETRVFNPRGNTTESGLLYSKPLIAHGIRVKAIDLALQLHDAYPSKKHQHSGSITLNSDLLNAILDALPREYASAVCDKLVELVSKDGN